MYKTGFTGNFVGLTVELFEKVVFAFRKGRLVQNFKIIYTAFEEPFGAGVAANTQTAMECFQRC